MRRWLVALVAVAAFGAGWIVNDVAGTVECREPSGESLRERVADRDVELVCE